MRSLAAVLAVAVALTIPRADAEARPAAGRPAGAATVTVSREHTRNSIGNWRQVFRILRPKYTRTLAHARTFTDIDVDTLNARRAMLGKPRLSAILVDIDETIAEHHGGVGREDMAHLVAMQDRGLVVGVYSNGAEDMNPRRAADIAAMRKMGIWVAGPELAAKPEVRGFEQALDGLAAHARARGRGFDRTRVAMVGDNFMTDGGAIQAGIDFVKVAPVPTDNGKFASPLKTLIKRTSQRALRAYGSAAAAVHDGGRAILRRPTTLALPAPAAE